MASNLGHQWEVLTSIMRVVILHSVGREETHFTVVRDIALQTKMASVRGTCGKRIGLDANIPKNALKIYWEIPVFPLKIPQKIFKYSKIKHYTEIRRCVLG